MLPRVASILCFFSPPLNRGSVVEQRPLTRTLASWHRCRRSHGSRGLAPHGNRAPPLFLMGTSWQPGPSPFFMATYLQPGSSPLSHGNFLATSLLPFFSWQLHSNQASPIFLMATSWQPGSSPFSHVNFMVTRLLPFFSWQLHGNQVPPLFLM